MLNHKFVFIGGLHRSGTSLLCRTLREHPQISGFSNTGAIEDEGQWLQSVYSPAQVYGGPGRFGFNQSSFMDEKSDLVSSENAQKLFQEWKKHWDLNKPVLLEKSPPNLVRSRFLQAMFPNSFLIIMLRHPIPVSYATQKWSNTSIDSLIKHWLICHERFDRDHRYLQNVLILKYENFIIDPQGILRKIYDFIGIQNVSISLDIRAGVNEQYFSRWQKLYKGNIKKFYAYYIHIKHEKNINYFGYSLKDLYQVNQYPQFYK
ncbi:MULTISPECIES: sulfotransferase family protein [unclassified Coleofasciculus]|uniref:sulfotransferase family protein n=1 Tax=unclassified Coleofasciculus TaxID=2692782 RepID=UPI00187F1E81|nr:MULTISPECIES: sulfotransferase [unclassified Coleofasciculus]MBE9126712.1 sulfotransferase [Coleofasciculus sp. LEGE 07081]MBE9150072.1 sulfotransferase [Coleofasciculus sp. LEGE 07092]